MITQYTDSYGSITADIQNLIANKVSLLDQYILMQTGQYEYTALIYNPASKTTKQYTITRSSNNYNSYYTVAESDVNSFEYSVSNEYYTYSNVGYGKSLDLPVYDGVISHSLAFMTCVLVFAILFKGVLFKCLSHRRK